VEQRTRRRRSSGEGSLYQTADGRWRGAVSYEDARGVSRRRYVSGPSQAAVRDQVAALRVDLGRGLTPAGATTLGAWLPRWLEAERLRLRPSTWRKVANHVRAYLVPALGRLRLARLSPGDVERAMAAWSAAGLGPGSVRDIRTTLRRALGDALRDGEVARNAASLARPPRLPQHTITYLTASEVRRLLAATADDDFLGPALAVMVSTGLRPAELLALTRADVDLAAGTLRVRHALARSWAGSYELAEPKTPKSRRTIVLPRLAAAALARRLELVDGDDAGALLFGDATGGLVRPDVLSAQFRTVARALGLAIDLRALRHTAATLALAAGVPITSVAEMLGHAGIAVTVAHYAAVVPELRRATAEAMDRALEA
jgi:integrase